LGIHPETLQLVDKNSIEKQVRQVKFYVYKNKKAFRNVEEILKEAGVGFNSVVKVNLYITDMMNYSIVNNIYSECKK
jgi:enamine deaminase RidA (YjgF/YER057c/UK114 family)